jgi:hypothetical protein
MHEVFLAAFEKTYIFQLWYYFVKSVHVHNDNLKNKILK